MTNSALAKILERTARAVIVIGFTLLIAGWSAVILIDGLAVLDLPDWMRSLPDEHDLALPFFFGEAANFSPALVENYQIVCLALAAFTSLLLACRVVRQGASARAKAACLLCLGLTLMYLNDGHNIRHQFTTWASIYWYGTLDYPLDNPIRIGLELLFYSIIGGVMMSTAWMVWRHKIQLGRSRTYFIVGYIAYAIASVASATRFLGDWYNTCGRLILSIFPPEMETRLASLQIGPADGPYRAEFWLMDWWIEESIELIGATCLLCAVLIVYSTQLSKGPADRATIPH